MSTLDAPGGASQPATVTEEALPAAPVVGPMAGDPSIFGLASFIAGSVALGLSLVGVVPFGVLGAPLAIILAATALGLLMSTIWAAAVGQSAVAAVFGIFGTFWLSYAVLVLGLDHSWFAIAVTAALATVKLFLLTWFVIIVMLTLATLRLPSAFTGVFVLVALALSAAVPWVRQGLAVGRAVERSAEERRLGRARLRRARRLPVLQRRLGGHRRQAAPARPPAAALTPGPEPVTGRSPRLRPVPGQKSLDGTGRGPRPWPRGPAPPGRPSP